MTIQTIKCINLNNPFNNIFYTTIFFKLQNVKIHIFFVIFINFILELKHGFSGTHCPPNLFLFSHIPCINAPESESILKLRNYFYSYFVYEETGAQKGQVKLAKVTLLLGTRIITLTFRIKNSCHQSPCYTALSIQVS